MNFQDIYFELPSAGFLVLVILVFFWLANRLYQYRKSTLTHFGHPEIVSSLLMPRSKFFYLLKFCYLSLAWVFASIAFMQPLGYGSYAAASKIEKGKIQTNKMLVKHRIKAQEVIFFLDSSASMTVEDTNSHFTRFEKGKEIVENIVSRLTGESVSLYSFTSEVMQIAPKTVDYLFVRLTSNDIHINEGGVPGTDFSTLLKFIKDKYLIGKSDWKKSVIILSDGEDTRIETLKGSERQKAIDELLLHLDESKNYGMRIFTIGIGSKEGKAVPNMVFEGKPVYSKLDEDLLKKISQKGNGKYYPSNNLSTLELSTQIVKEITAQGHELEDIRKVNLRDDDLIKTHYFQIPLGLAILFLILSIAMPETRFKYASKN